MMITQYVSLAKNNFFISHVFVPYTMSISIQYVFSQLISITSNLNVLLVFPHFFYLSKNIDNQVFNTFQHLLLKKYSEFYGKKWGKMY